MRTTMITERRKKKVTFFHIHFHDLFQNRNNSYFSTKKSTTLILNKNKALKVGYGNHRKYHYFE